MGRPYSPDIRQTAMERIRQGESIGDVADSIGASRSTLRRWLEESDRQPAPWSREEEALILGRLYPQQENPSDFSARVSRFMRHGRIKEGIESVVWLVAGGLSAAVAWGLLLPYESFLDFVVRAFTIYIGAVLVVALMGQLWSLLAPFDWVLIHLYRAEGLIRMAREDVLQVGLRPRRRLRRRSWNSCLRRAEKGMARPYVRGRDFATIAARQWDLAQRRAALADLMTAELLVHQNGPRAYPDAARLLRELIYQTLARQWSMSADRQPIEAAPGYLSPYSLAKRAAGGIRLAAGATLALVLNLLQFTDRLSL